MGREPPGVWLDGKFYDWAHLPPWFEDVLPNLGTYDEDGNLILNPKTLAEAEENAMRNRHGSEVVGCLILGTLVLAVVVAIIFVALLLG